MAKLDDTDLDRPRLPFALYAVVGVLALIGLFSISGFIFGTVFWLARMAVLAVLVLLVFWGLKAIFIGKARPDRQV